MTVVAQDPEAVREHEYLLGAAEHERQRLIGQGQSMAPFAERLLDRIGVAPGWHVADLGCGPLGILDLLWQRVGGRGRVVGVERDPRMLDHLRRTLTERRLDGVEVVEADATATGLPSRGFDLVHARLVLINVFDPEQVLAEMLRIARPGAVVVAQEASLVAGFGCFPTSGAWDRLAEVVCAVWRDGRDPSMGEHLPGLFAAAGAVEVQADAFIMLLRDGDPNFRMLPFFAGLLRDRILEAGLLTAAELDELIAAVDAHLSRPGVTVLPPTIYQTWGRRPA